MAELYRVDGELYTGVNEKPFLLRSSGDDYMTRFAKGTEMSVRVNAENPTTSIVRDEDQPDQ